MLALPRSNTCSNIDPSEKKVPFLVSASKFSFLYGRVHAFSYVLVVRHHSIGTNKNVWENIYYSFLFISEILLDTVCPSWLVGFLTVRKFRFEKVSEREMSPLNCQPPAFQYRSKDDVYQTPQSKEEPKMLL